MINKTILSVLILFVMIVPNRAQTSQKEMKLTIKTELNYLLFLPKTYSKKEKPSPMILFLHGSGERGTDLQKVKTWGPPAIVGKDVNFPFVVVSPQCPEGQWWNTYLLKALIDNVVAKYNIDQNRIYLTGISMGGYGAWELGMAYPELFAAIAPICGGGNLHRVGKLKDVPLWVFHGEKDEAVDVKESTVLVDALKRMNGNVKYSLLPEADHIGSWVYAYESSELFNWFLQQSKQVNK